MIVLEQGEKAPTGSTAVPHRRHASSALDSRAPRLRPAGQSAGLLLLQGAYHRRLLNILPASSVRRNYTGGSVQVIRQLQAPKMDGDV